MYLIHDSLMCDIIQCYVFFLFLFKPVLKTYIIYGKIFTLKLLSVNFFIPTLQNCFYNNCYTSKFNKKNFDQILRSRLLLIENKTNLINHWCIFKYEFHFLSI